MNSNPVDTDNIQAYNLKSLFRKALQKYRHRVAVVYQGEEYTYEELDEASTALANGLADFGVDSEDRIGVLMSNRPELIVSELAIVKAGGAKVLLNDMLSRDEIEYILRDSGTGRLICGPGFVETIDDLVDDLPELETVIEIGGTVDRFVPYETILSNGDSDESPSATPSPDDVLVHAYTGGTTGRPKGVLHTHRSRTMLYYSVLVELDVTGDDTMLVTTPLPHSAGSFTRSGLLSGAKIVLYPDFDAERTLSDIEDQGITWTFMVPTMIYRLLDHPNLDKYDLSTLRSLIYGAAPMKASRLREGLEQFGPIFKQFYGQTEIPNLITTLGKQEHVSALDGNEERLSSAGQRCLMADVKIVDPESDKAVATGEPGEILATAPYVMDRYYELPEKTAETVRDGWVSTGDIGKIDEDGYITLLDRMSNLVISGGMNVYTTEVEDAIVKHDDVKDAAVIGIPDDDWGEAVLAFVVPYDGHDITGGDVVDEAKQRLSKYKVPKRVEIVSSLPKTPYGKIDKTVLQEEYWDSGERRVN